MTEDESNRALSASPLLRSKLRRPTVPTYFVARPRLDRALDTVTERPLTLVIAPAGSGKTQLLSSWTARTEHPVAWLSLEEMDDDPVSLWTAAAAALDAFAPGCGLVVQRATSERTDASGVVGALLEGLEGVSGGAAVLVIDDVHHVKDEETASSLALFVQHLPAWLHVVMAGRGDPPIPLDRLRVRGQLAEMRFPELRFTAEEAGDVLAHLAPELSEADVVAAVDSTEGWAAGVQLVGLSARSAATQLQPTSAPSRAQVLTEDYVWHEVLAPGEPDVVDLLMRVAVVDRVSVRMATAITGRDDARELLLRGEAQGLFVYRLGTEDWFRIHPLVREQLYRELVRSGRHVEHHGRAALWLENAGETVSALDQWVLAGRFRDALRLVAARSTDLYDDGREAVIARTLAAIPRQVAMADLSAMVDFAVSTILGPLPAFLDAVQDALWHAERRAEGMSPSLDALNAIALATAGNWTDGEASARRAIVGLGDEWWIDAAGRFAWNTAARGVALSERWDDDDPFVRDATIAMRRDPRRGVSLEGIRALGHALAGRPVDALRIAAGVRHIAPTMSILRVELALADALARLEIGDRDRARTQLQALADQPSEPRLYATVTAMLTLAEMAIDDADLAAAAEQLAAAEALLSSSRGGVDLRDRARRTGAELAVATNDRTLARARVDAIVDPFWGPVERARLALVAGDGSDARAQLDTAAPRCPRHEVVRGLTRARAETGRDSVVAAVAPAVELASRHDMLQTVVTFGRDLMDVIERAAWSVPVEWLHRLRLAMAPANLPARTPARDYPELLTERERDVLRLLPSRLTVGEIAKELYVSVNTVKFHLRIIYRKLGVNSREEAAAVARSMTKLARTGNN
jgi:LuxR family maltose regulon positive regulatory protein